MIDKVFEIDGEDVKTCAKRELWYYGEGLKETGQPDFASQLQASTEDDPTLSRHLETALSSLAILIPNSFISVAAGSRISLTCSLPANFDTRQEGAISLQIQSYLVYSIVSLWLNTIYSEKAKDFETLVKEQLVLINNALSKRIIPQ